MKKFCTKNIFLCKIDLKTQNNSFRINQLFYFCDGGFGYQRIYGRFSESIRIFCLFLWN